MDVIRSFSDSVSLCGGVVDGKKEIEERERKIKETRDEARLVNNAMTLRARHTGASKERKQGRQRRQREQCFVANSRRKSACLLACLIHSFIHSFID